ncbi:probable MSW1 - tryptophanyl-tRNA synthetase, mitochondrial [Melanopsichium pennsylvanicum]|uniref:Tryptophan--tRNA ligase, mitochondrial n=2 Tax=Melanopsichium pennsylvanicum TaxID=63383 RepID=A0AAJ5C5Q2_9BASI|nr:probable MSW1-tryptophanyl-tRNA synthetase, mitochondrial [Melanopsichium pennsylvanicum 4]SNX84977.1 probable MSW1 - tryptophanyl-tRNA synthetase, mitochondrial [Melanopsichium pennsylvanicum]
MSFPLRTVAAQRLPVTHSFEVACSGVRRQSTLTASSTASPSQPSLSITSNPQQASKPSSQPRVILSGIQPTGIPHLGNYLGALRNWVSLQDSSLPSDSLYFSIVGFHAITLPQNPSVLRTERSEMLATLLAIGLDPRRCTIFHQDQVPQHTELAWILNCITAFGKLNRMTTWKSKIATAKNAGENTDVEDKDLSLGLFAYPVLQAADILLYKATHVPVGEDQIQHLELSRDLADVYNRRFKKKGFFPLPQHIITRTKRVLSLRDPLSKMSKSAPDINSRILITDTPEQVKNKIKKAVTDAEASISYSPDSRPGVSNLLSILAALKSPTIQNTTSANTLGPEEWAERLNKDIETTGASSGQYLKATLTEAIVETLRPIQAELDKLHKDPGYLLQMEKLGKDKAQTVARTTMAQVRKAIGLD